MSYLSILLKLVALECAGAWRLVAVAAWGVSVLADAVALRTAVPGRGRRRALALSGTVALLNAACLVLGWLAGIGADYLCVRVKEGIPALAAVLAVALNAIHLPASAVAGSLCLTTMSGSLNWLVSYDSLGARPTLTVLGLGLAYLLILNQRGREVWRRLAVYAPLVALAALLRAVFAIGLFVAACTFLNSESEQLPIRPWLEPSFVVLTLIPFLLLFAPMVQRLGLLRPGGTPHGAGPQEPPLPPGSSVRRQRRRLGLRLAAVVAFAGFLGLVCWEPRGTAKQGTVLIDTFHTQWSRTDRDYDKAWFGPASGYNYNSLKKFLGVYFDVRELGTRLSETALKGVSVLLIYDPDRAFTEEEREAISRFVDRGGGLLLLGDHSNVFGSSSHLNTLCGSFGLRYRDDVLFDLKENFFQIIFPGRFSPVLLKGIDVFRFRGPTSVVPTSPFTKVVMSVRHAKSLRAIYSVNNFYPRPANSPSMKTGTFATAVSAHVGRGRVLAFCDSTVFSQFELFQPGKYEFMLNGVDWLNHCDSAVYGPGRWLALIAGIVVVLGLLLSSRGPRELLMYSLALVAAGSLALAGANGLARCLTSLPPERTPARFLFFAEDAHDPRVGLTRFTPEGPYSERYDVFVQWVFRNDMFPAFAILGKEHGRLLYRHLSASPVAQVGVVFIIRDREQLRRLQDVAPELFSGSRRFLFLVGAGMGVDAAGEILAQLGANDAEALQRATPVPAVPDTLVVRAGGRTCVFVFAGDRFSDEKMGIWEKVVPNQSQKDLYELEYRVLDAVFADL